LNDHDLDDKLSITNIFQMVQRFRTSSESSFFRCFKDFSHVFPIFFPAGAIFLGPAPGRSRIPEMPTVPKMDLQVMEDGSETENREAENN
jgi:hypothetical protein